MTPIEPEKWDYFENSVVHSVVCMAMTRAYNYGIEKDKDNKLLEDIEKTEKRLIEEVKRLLI